MITIATVLSLVGRSFEIEPQLLSSENRSNDVVVARHVAIHLVRNKLGVSSSIIGKVLGDRDHGTVLSAERNFPDLLAKNPMLNAVVRSLGDQIDVLNDISERDAINPLDVARRVIANPKRVALMVNVHETVMLSKTLLELWSVAQTADTLSQQLLSDSDDETSILAMAAAINNEMAVICQQEKPETPILLERDNEHSS